MSMPGEVKDPTQGGGKCVTCKGLTNSKEKFLKTSNNNGQQVDRWSLMEEEQKK